MRDVCKATLTLLNETQQKPGHTEGYPGAPTQVKHVEQKRELTGLLQEGSDNTCVWKKLSQN